MFFDQSWKIYLKIISHFQMEKANCIVDFVNHDTHFSTVFANNAMFIKIHIMQISLY